MKQLYTREHKTKLYNIIQYNTIQFIQYNIKHYNTIQYNTIQYNTKQTCVENCIKTTFVRRNMKRNEEVEEQRNEKCVTERKGKSDKYKIHKKNIME